MAAQNLYAKYCRIKDAPFLLNDDEALAAMEAACPNFQVTHAMQRHWAVPTMPGTVKLQGGGALHIRVTGPMAATTRKSEFSYPFGATGLRLGLPETKSNAATK